MNLMNVDIANLLDLLWSWVSPSEDIQNVLRYQVTLSFHVFCSFTLNMFLCMGSQMLPKLQVLLFSGLMVILK